jgi:hypothetical protein
VYNLHVKDERRTEQWDEPLAALTQGFCHLELVITDLNLSEEGLCGALGHCKHLETLTVRNSHQHLSVEIALPTLKSIEIYSRHMSETLMYAISRHCTRLERLKVFESHCTFQCDESITNMGVCAVLLGCPSLQEMDVEYAADICVELRVELARRRNFCRINWSSWSAVSCELAQGVLAVSPHLVAIELKRCNWLTDAALTVCAQCCPLIEKITLSGCPYVTSCGIRALIHGSADKLREVRLSERYQLDDEAVLIIANLCGQLNVITMDRCPHVSNNALRVLVAERGYQLDTLIVLSGRAFDDATVLAIAEHCPGLRCFHGELEQASDGAVSTLHKRCVFLEWSAAAKRTPLCCRVNAGILCFLTAAALSLCIRLLLTLFS